MKAMPLGYLVLVLAVTPATRAQTTETAPTTGTAQPAEDAQTKALRQQLENEAAARKAERDKAIAADIARNPNGKNAQAAKKAAEAEKAAALDKQAAEEKAQADLKATEEAAKAKAETERQEAAARWEAGAADRERAEKAKKAAVEKWRKSAKPAPGILMGKRADGSFTVMVDGKMSTFATAAEAEAFAAKARQKADTTLSY